MNKTKPFVLVLAGLLLLLASLPATAQDATTISLRQAVNLALQNSRELKLAHVQYTVALNEAGTYRASFLPNLYTGSGAAYTHGFPSLPGGNAPAIFEMSYTQTLFNPLLKGQQRAAEERAKNMKLEADRTRDNVMVRMASVYLELAKVRHSLELMRSEQASASKILEVTRDRVTANQELPIELTRSELTAARVEERIIRLEGRERALVQEFRDLTAIPETQAIVVEADEPSFSVDLQENDVVADAMLHDPSVLEAENERAARQHLLQGARWSYWPTVDFVGQYSILSKFNNYDQFYKTFQRNNVNIGVQVTIPIFAAKTRAEVALAKNQATAAELSLGYKRDEVRLDVLQKVRGVRELEASREVARLELKLAQETLGLTQAKFEEGRATLRDIEQARLDESDKWVSFLDADFAREQGQLTLLQVTGQLAKVFQ